MANFRSVKTIFWSDSKIIEDFTPEDRYFYLYLLTNEKSNQLGCYELSIKMMCRDTGYNEETIKKLIDRFENEHEVIVYDYETKEIYLKNWHKYNWLNSEKTKKCVSKEFETIKSNKLHDLICPLYAPYISHGSNKEKEKEKEKEKNKEKREREIEISFSYTPPTLDTLISYFKELNYEPNEIYCKKFMKYYENKNWEGVNNWKSKFEEWCLKDEEEGKISKVKINPRKIYFEEDGRAYKLKETGEKYYVDY